MKLICYYHFSKSTREGEEKVGERKRFNLAIILWNFSKPFQSYKQSGRDRKMEISIQSANSLPKRPALGQVQTRSEGLSPGLPCGCRASALGPAPLHSQSREMDQSRDIKSQTCVHMENWHCRWWLTLRTTTLVNGYNFKTTTCKKTL